MIQPIDFIQGSRTTFAKCEQAIITLTLPTGHFNLNSKAGYLLELNNLGLSFAFDAEKNTLFIRSDKAHNAQIEKVNKDKCKQFRFTCKDLAVQISSLLKLPFNGKYRFEINEEILRDRYHSMKIIDSLTRK